MVLLIALALMGGLTLAAPPVSRRLGRDAGYVLAAGFAAVALVLSTASSTVLAGGVVSVSWSWIPSLGVSFTLRMDGLSALFCVLILGVGALIMAYSARYLPEGGPHGAVYCLITAFGGSMLGLVLAGDLVLLYVFWELTTVVSFLLIGMSGGKGTRPAARALLVTGAGGLALLGAVVLLVAVVGSSDLTAVLGAREEVAASPLGPAIAALVIMAAFTKSGQVPFHFWLPGAMVAITPVSAYLHAATMVKAGIYLLMRFSTLFAGEPGWTLVLMGSGLLTALLASVWALLERDLKALLAYSTVSQLGLLTASIGVGTSVALAAAVLHTFAHALFKATLFMLVGVIDREAGNRDIHQLSGLMRVMPVTAALTGLAGLSLAGVIPMIGFVSKESLFQGFTGARVVPGAGAVAGVLAVVISALTFAYAMRICYGVFAGPTLQPRLREPSWSFLAPAAVAAVAGLVLGPAVTVLNPLVRQASLDIEPWAEPPLFVFWHGFSIELFMSAATIGLGLVLFLTRDRVDRVLRRSSSLEGGEQFDRGYGALLKAGSAVAASTHRDSAAPFLARPVAGVVLLGGVGVVTYAGWGGARPPSGPADWIVLALVAMVVAGLVTARSVLGTVVLGGTVGLLMTVWFLRAGAVDVALTLLLAEIMTAIVAAFVLGREPRSLPRTGRRGALAAGGLAVLAGATAAAGTAALTGRREISEAGAFFLRAAEPETGGHNVVNTVLVDFRGFDTLGEISVLAVVALGLSSVRAGRMRSGSRAEPYRSPVLTPAYRVLAPFIGVLSGYLFLRGHQEPGGGFIAALVSGILVAFGVLIGRVGAAAGTVRPGAAWLPGWGLAVAVAAGLAAAVAGRAFLTPLKASWSVPLLGVLEFSSSLLFDFGVYLVVLGLMVTAVIRLGAEEEPVG
ncbi:hydrogen gas-evolving membrane-bound hydrogenase subunit E [Actinocorallia populi]|uniref:hydrogen gas-evolving membrane-bound hydrogenase subunit E n=1 Tax=Actinocorallia populi TaxID=2079200 RepID=UPI0018E4EA8E|nr:hydrogen gas-evolving membrane-bound hydrogenase subunit E [Actinocorallia populi]